MFNCPDSNSDNSISPWEAEATSDFLTNIELKSNTKIDRKKNTKTVRETVLSTY